MGRNKRIWYEGARYHLMGRGNRRCAIFKDEEDYRFFLLILGQIQQRYPFELHAYCLMTNHFHLEITTIDTPIWKIMQPLMNHYARTFNQKYGYSGHLFDSRYESKMIENNIYFLEVSRYIHLNPVRAAMVREPQAYKYSSYGLYVTDTASLTECKVDTRQVLDSFSEVKREQYRLFVEAKISHSEMEMLIQKDIKEDDSWLPW